MTALRPNPSNDTALSGAVFEAVADAMHVAGTYADTAVRFAEIKDARGLAYATRCAVAAVATAAEMAAELRPQAERGHA